TVSIQYPYTPHTLSILYLYTALLVLIQHELSGTERFLTFFCCRKESNKEKQARFFFPDCLFSTPSSVSQLFCKG
ncbi:MAG TPA: hypothetical protein PKC72_17010, partial [Chitinophagaceae bacterium]|nr:hypothetical protein [Chitinophagaceae bacterium]